METSPIYYNTLDIDSSDKELFERIFLKVTVCPYALKYRWVDTQKGYHVRLWCAKECDLCRLVFDDSKRFAIDWKRPRAKQNVLFEPFSAKRILNQNRNDV